MSKVVAVCQRFFLSNCLQISVISSYNLQWLYKIWFVAFHDQFPVETTEGTKKETQLTPDKNLCFFFFKITSWLGQTSLQKGRLDYRVSVPGTWCWNQVISASFVHLIWLQGKTRILTCWSKEKEKRKIFGTKCSSSSAPPCPQHAVGLKGAESLLSPTLTGPPASEPSDTGSMRPTLNKRWKALCLPCRTAAFRIHLDEA